MQHSNQPSVPGSVSDIRMILQDKCIQAYFQQVVSVGKKCVCGLEGLIHGTRAGEVISPRSLFQAAEEQDLTLQLDRICRERVLQEYGKIYAQHRDKLLFINIEAKILDQVSRTGVFARQVKDSGINPGNIVIEINEARVQDIVALKDFIEKYRSDGFLIALDDVGAGFSNLDRIPIAKPDIIKVDTSLVRNIHIDYHKQEVFKSLIRLAEQTGAFVVAEGVENEEEALQALRLGAHMIQGFYFSRPAALTAKDPFVNESIEPVANSFKDYMQKNIRLEVDRRREICRLVQGITEPFGACAAYEPELRHIIGGHESIECAYVLDETGTQCCDAVFRENMNDTRKRLLVCSASAGADHSMKNYYYNLASENLEHYITEPYVSPLTGSLCVTVSLPFGAGSSRRILCLNLKAAL